MCKVLKVVFPWADKHKQHLEKQETAYQVVPFLGNFPNIFVSKYTSQNALKYALAKTSLTGGSLQFCDHTRIANKAQVICAHSKEDINILIFCDVNMSTKKLAVNFLVFPALKFHKNLADQQ